MKKAAIIAALVAVFLIVIGSVSLTEIRDRLFGSSRSVESMVRQSMGDPDADCTKRGIMAFAGSSVNVYECIISPPQRFRCFVKAKGDLYEVTKEIHALKQFNDDVARDFGCG